MSSVLSNTSRTWNAGNCCGAAANWNSNDKQFLFDILDDIEINNPFSPLIEMNFLYRHSNVRTIYIMYTNYMLFCLFTGKYNTQQIKQKIMSKGRLYVLENGM